MQKLRSVDHSSTCRGIGFGCAFSTKTKIFVFNVTFIYVYCLGFYIVSELVDIRIWEILQEVVGISALSVH